MLSKLRPRLTFANVVSMLALVVALSGGAYAATQLPANSVGTKQIKKHAVTLRKIAPSAQSSLRGQRGPRGRRGAAGPGAVALFKENAALEPKTNLVPHPLAQAGPYAIGYRCLSFPADLRLVVDGPRGRFQDSHVETADDASPRVFTSGGDVARGETTTVAEAKTFGASGSGHYYRSSGTALVTSLTGPTVTIQYSLIVDERTSATCDVYGSAFATG